MATSISSHDPMIRRTVSTPNPSLDARVLALLDAADEPVSIATGELLPEFRSSGFFDTLQEVVETGVPYYEAGAQVADAVTGGEWVGGIYDMRAIRLGDGYFSTWRRRAATPKPD